MYRQLFVRVFGGFVVYSTVVLLFCVIARITGGNQQEDILMLYMLCIFAGAVYGVIVTALFYHNWGIWKYSRKNKWLKEEMQLLYEKNQSGLYLQALQRDYEMAWNAERKQFYLLYLAEAYQFVGDFQSAKELLEEALPDRLGKAERGYYYCVEAWNFFFLGEIEKACDIVEQQEKQIRYAGYGKERMARVHSLFMARELAEGNQEKGFQAGGKALNRLYFAGDEKWFYLLYAGYHMKQKNYDEASLFLLELCVGVNLPYIQQQLNTWIQQWETAKGETFPHRAPSKREARERLQQQIGQEVYTRSVIWIYPAAARDKKPMKYSMVLLVLEILYIPNIYMMLYMPFLILFMI